MNIHEINEKKWNSIFGNEFRPNMVNITLGQMQSEQLKIHCRIDKENQPFADKLNSREDINRICFSIIFDGIKKISITPPFSGLGIISIEKKTIKECSIYINNLLSFQIESETIQISDIKMDYFDINNEGL